MAAARLDAVVVGAGCVGLAVTRELALRGAGVACLERGPRHGEGITSRNSEVVHAESALPDGPYHTVGEPVVLPFAHNPTVSVAADGTVVVYHIGSGTTPRSKQGNCSGGVSGLDTNGTRAWCAASLPLDAQAAAPRAGQKWSAPNVAFSTSGPSGPWVELSGGSSWGADNPAPVYDTTQSSQFALVAQA